MLILFILLVIFTILISVVSFLSCKKYAEAHKEQGIDQDFIRGFRLRAFAGVGAEFLVVMAAIVLKILL